MNQQSSSTGAASQWNIMYRSEALNDLKKLKEPRASHARKAIRKASINPVPITEGGYGKPLGNKHGQNLTGLFKLKLRTEGIRIVYMLERTSKTMTILVVSVRDDMQVYETASLRRNTPPR